MRSATKTDTNFRFNYSIRSYFFVATVFFILLLGGLLGWFHYKNITEMLLNDAHQMFEQATEDVVLNFNGTYNPIKQSVDLLSYTKLMESNSFTSRATYLPMIVNILEKNPAALALQVGYKNKEFFIVRKLNSDYMTSQFNAPNESRYVVDNIAQKSGSASLVRRYYDQSLNQISTKKPEETSFDTTTRPWFIKSKKEEYVIATNPYLFFFTNKVGLTLARHSNNNGSVVAADVLLPQLTNTLNKNKITPSTKLYIIASNERILASSEELTLEKGNHFKEVLDSNEMILSSFWKTAPKNREQGIFIEKDNKNRSWLAVQRTIKLGEDKPVTLVILVPKDELLLDALVLRNQSALITLLIILFSIPAAFYISSKISKPLKLLAMKTAQVSRFDFTHPVPVHSAIVEIEQLGYSMQIMQDTIYSFVEMIESVTAERDFEHLLEKVTGKTIEMSSALGAAVYLVNDDETYLTPACSMKSNSEEKLKLSPIKMDSSNPIAESLGNNEPSYFSIDQSDAGINAGLLKTMQLDKINLIIFPLKNRQIEPIGVLVLVFDASAESTDNKDMEEEKIQFIKAVTGFSALTIESSKMAQSQKDLLEAFIKLIAGAIDEKSPYTGGHCQRVPVLTKMLAQAACDSNAPKLSDFNLEKEQWEELHIASWLHDCGKVTTPEYVVDKSTKLETIYDRIHEVRMRFEVIKKERELTFWKAIANGENKETLDPLLREDLKQLDDDFSFVADCNTGGEFMAPDKIERLTEIADHKWLRTLDDRLGLSWEELQRKSRIAVSKLPVEESLLANRDDHLIPRNDADKHTEDDNSRGFKLDVPEYKMNKGELYNLSIEKGTLSEEERFIINNHIVQTIIMLEKLPFPKNMKSVPEIAGGHHEKMNGKGYPKRLHQHEMPLTARMMAIADIFEALTASDRPYKKAKTVSESIKIMSFMSKDQHIDADLFELFLKSGVYMDYAEQYLLPGQIDKVDISQYIATS